MITSKTKHDRCQVYVQIENYIKTTHYASLRCIEHNAYIQWLNKWDVEQLKVLGVQVKNKPQEYLLRGDWV